VFDRFTNRARRVLVMAQEESRLLGHDFLGTEHLLLGLIRVGGPSAHALHQTGVTLEVTRRAVQHVVGLGNAQPGDAGVRFTSRAKKVLELSLREALQLDDPYISTGHILLGLLQEDESVVCHTLVNLGVDTVELRAIVMDVGFDDGDDSAVPPYVTPPENPPRAG
jgi:ATP-dependent Clp protease ATP-binding subunit ClpC